MIWIFHLYADFHTKHSPSEKVSNRITQIAMPGQDSDEKSEISRDVPRIVCWVISHQRPRNGKNIEWMSNVALRDISLAQNLKAWGELFPFLKSVLLAWWWVRGWVKRQKSWKSLKNPKKAGRLWQFMACWPISQSSRLFFPPCWLLFFDRYAWKIFWNISPAIASVVAPVDRHCCFRN